MPGQDRGVPAGQMLGADEREHLGGEMARAERRAGLAVPGAGQVDGEHAVIGAQDGAEGRERVGGLERAGIRTIGEPAFPQLR